MGARSFVKKLFGTKGDGKAKLGWMKIAEEARDHLSEVSSVPLRFWSCWDTGKKGNRKEGIEERTCGRHVSWKRTTRMMNLSRGRPRRCTTMLAGLLFAYRRSRKYFSPPRFPEWRCRATSIFVGSCKHGIASVSRHCWKVLFGSKFAGCFYTSS